MSFPSPATEVPATENAEHNRDDLAYEPIFTAQDEQRELATLSIADITSLQSDLTGISVGLSTLPFASGVLVQLVHVLQLRQRRRSPP
mmetsp:Transcript_26795/g.58119  ORF Transcript_26795/g.58119 Transcript_26795/m.58119 type:complete len:88 (-) Transcript_26795:1627-1890(-)